ncbi:unnamed protein product [Macrosiphum euphorbiae]|uniref:Uncharacterized protein n=1 Tax=Macrosiphum euphorbiae TaxID=13131 RepID=A0AAV0WY11_9HEMI|nr:unnamed protein product [Macrosiphum euphorbiae]
MEASISRFEERLEKQIYIYLETKQKISELEDTSSELHHRITCEQKERRKLEAIFTNGRLPDEAKINFSSPSIPILQPPSQPMTKSCVSIPHPAPTLKIFQLNLPQSPGCLPQLVGKQRSVEIPKPFTPLRSFN